MINHIMERPCGGDQGKHMVNCRASRGRSEKLAVEARTLEDAGRAAERQ